MNTFVANAAIAAKEAIQGQPDTFLSRALPLIARNVPVIPLKPKTKIAIESNWPQLASTDVAKIEAWQQQYPDANCGAVAFAKPGEIFIWETDSPEAIERMERETGHKLPVTYCVRSSPGKAHHYFKQTVESIKAGNIAQGYVIGGDWSLRVSNQYVVAQKSVHPDTGLPYEVISDAPIADAPDWLIEWLISQKVEKKSSSAQATSNELLEGSRNTSLASEAGTLREKGWSHAEVEAALLAINIERCRPPLPDAEVKTIAASICSYEAGSGKDNGVLCGGKPAGTSATKETGTKNENVILSSELTTTRADTIKTKEVKWLWPQRIPYGKLTVLAGNPDQGKSLVTMYIAAQLTSGRPLFQSTATAACDVLVMAGEDDASDTVVPRLVAAGADLSRVHLVESITTRDGKGATVGERELQLDTDVEKIEATLKANRDIRLVVIDPLSNYLGRANMNREQEVRQVLIPLKLLAGRTGVAIVCVMHLNKSSDASAIHRIGGAVAFTGVARAVWLFLEDPDDSALHLMLRVKGNLAKRGGGLTYKIESRAVTVEESTTSFMPYIEWAGETEQNAQDILIGGNPAGRPEKVGTAMEWLAKFLSGGSETSDDIKAAGKKLGFTDRTVERAIDQAKVDLGLCGGWYSYFDNKKKKRTFLWWLPGHKPKDAVSLDRDIEVSDVVN